MIEDTPVQPIQENLWWVIPGKLAGVRRPNPEEISALQTAGVGAIVSIMDDPANLDLYQQVGLPYLWLPIKGGTAPGQLQIQKFQSFVEEQNRLGRAVAVHCTSGRRRTGTMLAAYLIQRGMTFKNALQTILIVNPNVELREAQIVSLQALAGKISTL